MSEHRPSNQRLWRVDWRNKRTGVEFYEDFIRAPDFEGAIREARKQIARAEGGVAVADIEIIDVGERNE